MDLLDASYNFWNEILLWDKWLFLKINSEYTNPAFDYIMPYLRNSVYWTPLYLFVFAFVTMNYKKKGWWWCVLFLCLVAMTDIISSRVFKETFDRIRPCNEPEMLQHMRLLVRGCPGGYGFTSSHAANHFGMATYFFLTFRFAFKKWVWIAFAWAAIVCYAQLYVGVHYPLDIIGGAFLGIFFGALVAKIFHTRFGFITFDKQPTGA
jgi:membrane-associated phospholipid phosphatase